MKNFNRLFLAALLVFVTVSSYGYKEKSVKALASTDDANAIENPFFAKCGNNVVVSFNLAVPGRFIKSRQGCVVTPTIINGDYRKTLPPVLVEGRNYRLVTAGKRQFDKFEYPDYYAEKDRNSEGMTIPYKYTLPFEEQMKGSVLVLDQVIYCACGDINASSQEVVTNSGIIDYTNLYTTAGMRAYYQKHIVSLTREDIYEIDTKSVFNIGSVELKKDVFVEGQYADFIKFMEDAKDNKNITVNHIKLYTASSPDGREALNNYLAKQRSQAIASFMKQQFAQEGLPVDKFESSWDSENWKGFEKILDQFDNADEIRAIIAGTADYDAREAQMRELPNFREILACWQTLRSCNIKTEYTEKVFETVEKDGNMVVGDQTDIISFEAAEQYLKDDESNQNLSNMMLAYMEREQLDKAMECANRMDNRTIDATIANNKGVLYTMTGDYDKAIAFFNKADGVKDVEYNKGVAYLYIHDYENAARCLAPYDNSMAVISCLYVNDIDGAARKVMMCPDNALTYYLTAITYARRGDEARVINYLGKAVAADASYKEKAMNQAEFITYRELDSFKQIIVDTNNTEENEQ